MSICFRFLRNVWYEVLTKTENAMIDTVVQTCLISMPSTDPSVVGITVEVTPSAET